jgi:hypothetical protein
MPTRARSSVFSNYRHEEGLPAAFQTYLQVRANPSRWILLSVVQAIDGALSLFGNLPTSFDDELLWVSYAPVQF